VSPHLLIELPVLPLSKKMKVQRPEDRAERIRIALRPLIAAMGGETEKIGKAFLYTLQDGFKKAVRMYLDGWPCLARNIFPDHGHCPGIRPEYPDD